MAYSTSTLCGHPIKSRAGRVCTNRAKHFLAGGHSCGMHLKCINGLPTPVRELAPPPPPPPPSEEGPFVPFDCGICMDECTSAASSCETICNHRFHKNCLLSWEKAGRSIFSCPMCRKVLPRSVQEPLARPRVQEPHRPLEARIPMDTDGYVNSFARAEQMLRDIIARVDRVGIVA